MISTSRFQQILWFHQQLCSSIFAQGLMCSYFLKCLFVITYCYDPQVFEKLIHCSTFKYSLEDSVESICHTRFESTWYFYVGPWISSSYPSSSQDSFSILAHEVPLVFFLMQIGNIFIMHHKIRILHITFLALIILNFTVYDICNL